MNSKQKDQEKMMKVKKSKKSLSLFKLITPAVSASVAAGLILSITYDQGYFFALRMSFGEAPTTLSDHVQSWLFLTPMALFFGYFYIEHLFERKYGLRNNLLVSCIAIPAVVCLAILFRYLVTGEFYGHGFTEFVFWAAIGVALSVCWAFLVIFLFDRDETVKKLPYSSKQFRIVCGLGPYLLILVFFWGLGAAKSQISHQAVSHRLHFSDEQFSVAMMDVQLLRSFEQWILVRGTEQRISWIREDVVGEIERLD